MADVQQAGAEAQEAQERRATKLHLRNLLALPVLVSDADYHAAEEAARAAPVAQRLAALVTAGAPYPDDLVELAAALGVLILRCQTSTREAYAANDTARMRALLGAGVREYIQAAVVMTRRGWTPDLASGATAPAQLLAIYIGVNLVWQVLDCKPGGDIPNELWGAEHKEGKLLPAREAWMIETYTPAIMEVYATPPHPLFACVDPQAGIQCAGLGNVTPAGFRKLFVDGDFIDQIVARFLTAVPRALEALPDWGHALVYTRNPHRRLLSSDVSERLLVVAGTSTIRTAGRMLS